MAEENIAKTAIITPFGFFEYVGMPFGLRNASQTCQRYIDTVFRDFNFVFCYIDDIIIISESPDEHKKHLEAVFRRLQDHGLIINSAKCQLGQPEVIFLGYVINAHGYKPPQDRVKAILEYSKPEIVSELRRFLGMINYNRRCIPGLAKLQAPLTEYLKSSKKNDKTKINWNPTARKAFVDCRESIAAVTATAFTSPSAPLALTTDASDIPVGASLEQLEGNQWKPIGFFSRKLSPAEKNYSTYDRELLAIYAAIKHFRHILECHKFTIKTDHKPLTYAFLQRADKASPRQPRQLDFISQFSTEITHVKGQDNVVADALSRINAIDMPTTLSLERIQEEQQQDQELKQILNGTTSLHLQKLTTQPGVSIYCDISTGTIRPYIPQALRFTAFNTVHGSSHSSGRVT